MENENKVQELPGIKQAALVIVAMGSEAASIVMKSFSDSEIEKLTVQIAQLKDISAEQINDTIDEYYQAMQASDYIVAGGLDYAREVLEAAYGHKKAEEILQKVEATTEVSAFYLLQTVDDRQLLNFLQNEHPQTTALILANLKAPQAAAILSELPESQQAEIAYRLATMEKTSPELIREIELALRDQIGSVFGGEMSTTGGPEAVAEILNSTSRSAEKNILTSLKERDPKMAEEVTNLMFMFEDIYKLSDATIQRIVREVESKTLAMALKATTPELKEKVLRNMSERAAEMLKDELQFLGPVRVKEVENSQKMIIDVVRELEDSGEISLKTTDEEEIIE